MKTLVQSQRSSRTWIMRWPPDAAPRGLHEFLDAHPFQGVDELFQFRRQAVEVVAQSGNPLVLHHVPPLHDHSALGKVHLAGSSDARFDNPIVPEMAACALLFSPPSAKKISLPCWVLQEAL
jgi:hypothetical protein